MYLIALSALSCPWPLHIVQWYQTLMHISSHYSQHVGSLPETELLGSGTPKFMVTKCKSRAAVLFPSTDTLFLVTPMKKTQCTQMTQMYWIQCSLFPEVVFSVWRDLLTILIYKTKQKKWITSICPTALIEENIKAKMRLSETAISFLMQSVSYHKLEFNVQPVKFLQVLRQFITRQFGWKSEVLVYTESDLGWL